MRRTLTLAAIALIALACHKSEQASKEDIQQELKHSGVTDLAKSMENDRYTPPKDGKLTDTQVQMYLKVREREKAIAQVAKQEMQKHAEEAKKSGEHSLAGTMEGFKAMGSVADFVTADIRAAKDLGYNTQEYVWVKSQILTASTTAATEKLTTAMNASMDAAYLQMKKAYDEAKDEQQKAALKTSLDQMEQQRAEQQKQQAQADPAIAYNKQLLSKYEDALKAFTNELAKYENKEGDAQKQMDEFNKSVDTAVQNAKKQQ
jgi:hypothetical protein